MLNQAYVFVIFILNGFIIGILYDIFRILRKSFKTVDFITYIEDIVFWILTGLILLYSIFKFNNGELRLYIFLGIALGAILYNLIFSNVFVKINVKIILFVKKIIDFLLIKPIKCVLKLIRRILFKPISFIFINIRKNVKNIKKIHFFGKKSKYKKDLT